MHLAKPYPTSAPLLPTQAQSVQRVQVFKKIWTLALPLPGFQRCHKRLTSVPAHGGHLLKGFQVQSTETAAKRSARPGA